jgi:hypothetical protein
VDYFVQLKYVYMNLWQIPLEWKSDAFLIHICVTQGCT